MVHIYKGDGIFQSWCMVEEYFAQNDTKQVLKYAHRATYVFKMAFFGLMDNIRGHIHS